jgi:two-component system chemotaxis response regulator CheB
MPRNAMDAVAVDGAGPPAMLARELARWVVQPAPAAATAPDDDVQHEAAIHLGKEVVDPLTPIADPSTLTCPDCGGTLWQVRAVGPERYRCHTGHAFTSLSLEIAQAETAESALWAALRALREREMLLLRLARIAHATGDPRQAAAGEAKAERVHRQVLALGRMLEAGGAHEAPEASA